MIPSKAVSKRARQAEALPGEASARRRTPQGGPAIQSGQMGLGDRQVVRDRGCGFRRRRRPHADAEVGHQSSRPDRVRESTVVWQTSVATSLE